MLEIRNLNKSFDGLKAVDDFSLSLKQGKITSLIGSNGAGKTTVFNLITGFLHPNSGSIEFNGTSLIKLPPYLIARKGIARTFQNLRLFKKMSVFDNILLARQNQKGEGLVNAVLLFSNSSIEHKAHIERVEFLLEFVGLIDKRNELAENLSYGQQKLLSIACCLATEPQLLLLDEPVAGVQPAMIEKIKEVMEKLVKREKKTIFLIEHDINVVMEVSDIVVVMDHGKKIAEDVPKVIKEDNEILEAYLS